MDDLRHFEGASRTLPVLCSELVTWKSEWRIYDVRGAVVGKRPYSGEAPIDDEVVARAVAALTASGRAPAAYGIDFGVLDSGVTALVEMNDGYGLGSYALEDALYTDLVLTRWLELVAG